MSLAVAMIFPNLGETSLIYGLMATAILDSGHVYTTAWRTNFHPESAYRKSLYWLTPLLFFCFFLAWSYSQLPGIWSFVVYSTLFHHVRQTYGFSKWYQTLNRRKDKNSDRFLYALSLIPICLYHFREGVIGGYYSNNDLFLRPENLMVKILFIMYVIIVFGWLTYEVLLWKRRLREWNRLFSVAFPALIYGYCFLWGQSFTQVLFPLLIVHGSAYLVIMTHSLTRTQRARFRTPLVALCLLGLTALIFGLGESFIEESSLGGGDGHPSVLRSALIALTLTPLYSHYVFDAMIWKKSHPEASAIFAAN
jgi:hypothetical protein